MKKYRNLKPRGGKMKMTVTEKSTVPLSGYVGIAIGYLLMAWVVMIVWGILALEFATPEWTISYPVSCAVLVALYIIQRVLRRRP